MINEIDLHSSPTPHNVTGLQDENQAVRWIVHI